MKILSSKIDFSSDHLFQKQDEIIEEKTSRENIRESQTRSDRGRNRLNQPINQNRPERQDFRRDRNWRLIPQILVDRVSIEQNSRMEFQSNYSASISSNSKVTSFNSNESVEISQQLAMEKIVGGLIDKDVTFSGIENQENVLTVGNEPVPQPVLENLNLAAIQTDNAWEMSIKRTRIHFEDESVNFRSNGMVTTEDGREIDFSMDISLNRKFLSRQEEETLVRRWQENVALTDPLVISMDGNVPRLSDTRFEFDLDADGNKELIHFVNAGAGFLAFDKNKDQRINDGSELFGPGTGNGFEELAAHDLDQNGWIDENDEVFSQLSVWSKDKNGKDRLISLKDAGIGAVHLDYGITPFNMTGEDNSLKGKMQQTGLFLFENGQVGSVHQIDLAAQEKSTLKISEREPDPVTGTSESINPNFSFTKIPSTSNQSQVEDVINPLEQLLDRIEKIKEEMGKLYEALNSKEEVGRHRRKRRRVFNRIQLDSSVLLSDRLKLRRGYRTNRYI